MTRILRLLILGLTVTCVNACVAPAQYRYLRSQPGCFPNSAGPAADPIPGDPKETRDWPSLDCRSAHYKVGFIEFDDEGTPRDPKQLEKTLALIANEKRRAPSGKIITLLYVHGWKNNASQAVPGGPAKDVERFEGALTELGYRGAIRTKTPAGLTLEPGIPIVGVYIGWRGKSLMGPSWFTFASYWGRRNSANRVGNKPLAEALTAIVKATKESGTTSRVVMIGHSFGARVLEHAIDAGDVKLYDVPQGDAPVTPLVDLVLYVNSANDARITLKRISALRTEPLVVRHPDFDAAKCASAEAPSAAICRAYPYIVTIMSRGDQATKRLLPLANTINLDDRSVTAVVPPGQFADSAPSAGTFRKRSAGHMRFLQSHDVEDTSCPATGQPACTGCEFAFKTWADNLCYAVRRREPVEQRSPFNTTASWVMSVDTTVMKDHGDIWNLSMVSMLGQLMAPRGFFDPGARPLQLRRAAAGTTN